MSSMLTGVVNRFSVVIEQRLGLKFDEDKRDYLASVLLARLEKSGETGTAYLDRLELLAEGEEWSALSQLLTVSETYFFRHFDQFKAFVDIALPDRMLAQSQSRRLSILSAGCASGEEAYSLAMMIRDASIEAPWKISIRGADINPAVIARAIDARYSTWSLRETPREAQRKWFRSQGREYVLDDAIRNAVQFERRNLAENDQNFWRPESYDIIFCRNMMMYFSTPHAHALMERITRALVPGGYLFLGHAETLRGISLGFHLRHTHGTFYYQRRHLDESKAVQVAVSHPAQPRLPLAVVDRDDSWVESIRHSSERIQALAASQSCISAQPGQRERIQCDLKHAQSLLRQERFADALNVFRVLPVEAADYAEALLLKAVLYVHNGQLGDAEQVSQLLLDRDKLDAGAQYVLALCREEDGDQAAAVNHNQMAAYIDPCFAMPRLQLGLLARRAGDCESARRELEQALVLLQREDASRLLLFGGGFSRDALLALCRAELTSCGGGQ